MANIGNVLYEFERLGDFLNKRTKEDEERVYRIFEEFVVAFWSRRAEFPHEFENDIGLYRQKHPPMVKRFEDIEIRYLCLSDFYDYCRLMKIY